MEEAIENFVAFTGASPEIARRYLGFTENNPEQAIQLFFDSPDLASGLESQVSPPPPVPVSTRPQAPNAPAAETPSREIIDLSSDDEHDNMDMDSDEDAARAAALSRAADVEDDEAMARRMQEELYAGGDASGAFDAEGVRAPIARRTETLIGGPEDDGNWNRRYMDAEVAQQLRNRAEPGFSRRPNPFQQRPVAANSIWNESPAESAQRQASSQPPTSGPDASQKAARLAELFRPPFELMNQLDWDQAREKGKEEMKWILVNIQDPSIFDCQSLNRDIWKDNGVKEVVRENFVFMQYSKDDPRGQQYIQYYFPLRDSSAAYPHIAIVDPRTGEQVKIWSGPPVPKVGEFLMQLVEFLDRYSLDHSKSNPVAKRKPEKSKSLDVDRLTEEEMLDLALQNSLASSAPQGPREEDPDELTKSFGDIGKGKGKEIASGSGEVAKDDATNGHAQTSPFSRILSNNPHIEPAQGPAVTRIQFRHSNGRIVRRFSAEDTVLRLFEWLKAEPLEGKEGVEFELKSMGKNLIEHLDETIEGAGLKNGTVMVEYLED